MVCNDYLRACAAGVPFIGALATHYNEKVISAKLETFGGWAANITDDNQVQMLETAQQKRLYNTGSLIGELLTVVTVISAIAFGILKGVGAILVGSAIVGGYGLLACASIAAILKANQSITTIAELA